MIDPFRTELSLNLLSRKTKEFELFDSMRAATGTEQGRALSNSVNAFENLAVPETRLAEQDFYNRILLCFLGSKCIFWRSRTHAIVSAPAPKWESMSVGKRAEQILTSRIAAASCNSRARIQSAASGFVPSTCKEEAFFSEATSRCTRVTRQRHATGSRLWQNETGCAKHAIIFWQGEPSTEQSRNVVIYVKTADFCSHLNLIYSKQQSEE